MNTQVIGVLLSWFEVLRDCQCNPHTNKRTRGWEEDHQLMWLPSLKLWYPIDDLVLQPLPSFAIEAHRQSHRSWEVAAGPRPSMTQRNRFSPSTRLHVTFSLVLRTSSPTPEPLTFILRKMCKISYNLVRLSWFLPTKNHPTVMLTMAFKVISTVNGRALLGVHSTQRLMGGQNRLRNPTAQPTPLTICSPKCFSHSVSTLWAPRFSRG